jgi:hypothetical protein
MSWPAVLGERPRGSRIDDRRPVHISTSPETGPFRPATTLAPKPTGLAATSPAAMLLRTRALMR